MLSARYLDEAGMRVLLLERGPLGREASWAGGGILSPLYPWQYPDAVNRMAALSQRVYPQLASELEAETGVDPQWIASGMLVLDPDEQVPARRWAAYYDSPVEVLGGDALRACEPVLAARFEQGLWLPNVAQIRSPRLVRTLHASLKKRGVGYREHSGVNRLVIRNNKVAGVETAQEVIGAERVLVAAGAWSAHLIPNQYASIQVEPVRGQMILLKAKPRLVRRIILHEGDYLIPRNDGRVLVGSTVENAGFDKATTMQAQDDLRAKAVEWVPALADCPIEHHWSGLRPGSPAGIPYVGEHPDIEGLYFNTGHFRCGVVLAPASARLAVDLMLGHMPKLPPEPYAIDALRPSLGAFL